MTSFKCFTCSATQERPANVIKKFINTKITSKTRLENRSHIILKRVQRRPVEQQKKRGNLILGFVNVNRSKADGQKRKEKQNKFTCIPPRVCRVENLRVRRTTMAAAAAAAEANSNCY